MGKDWYWAGKSSKRGSNLSSSEGVETTQTPSGCMCAVFHFFDFHPFHFPTTLNQQQQSPFKSTTFISKDHTIPQGTEAPRNSLESEDGTTTTRVSSFSKEDDFKIPIKNIKQIKTTSVGGNLNDCSSPGTKTPTLVARLMGLDLLPNANSPSFSSSTLSTPNTQGNNNVPDLYHLRTKQYIQTKPRNSIDSSDITTRSLPETPRISSSRRSDVDHHRLSLQIIKENYLGEEDLELPSLSFSKRKNDENINKSPSHYARQIVKQVKESVSRRVGQDITNINTLKRKDQARGEFAGLRVKKSPNPSLKLPLDESSQGKNSISNQSSCSPRLRFIDTMHKPNTTTSSSPQTPKDQNTNLKTPSPHQVVVNTQSQLPRVLTKQKLLGDQKTLVPKCNKKVTTTNEKFSSRFKRPPQTSDVIRNKQEETFIIRLTSPTRSANDIKSTKSKKIQPSSSNLLNNINNVPNLVAAVKTHPSPPATEIHQKQVSDTQEFKFCTQLSSYSRQRYKQEGTSTLATQETNTEDNFNGVSTTTGASEHHKPEFQYITQILNRTNPSNTTTVLSIDQWFSHKNPLDPSIFHHLEHNPNDKDRNFTTKNQLGYRWNRKLLFDLVDEVVKEILRPKSNEKRLCFLHGFCYNLSLGELSEKVWKRVEDFPCAKCEVLEDIDNLIEAEDMEKLKVEGDEEGERLVEEIEGKIFDTLVHEAVMVMKWGPYFYGVVL